MSEATGVGRPRGLAHDPLCLSRDTGSYLGVFSVDGLQVWGCRWP